jgi:hypothetical protein
MISRQIQPIGGAIGWCIKKPGSLIADCRVIFLGADKRPDVTLVRHLLPPVFYAYLKSMDTASAISR